MIFWKYEGKAYVGGWQYAYMEASNSQMFNLYQYNFKNECMYEWDEMKFEKDYILKLIWFQGNFD